MSEEPQLCASEPLRRGSHHNAVVNHPVSSFGMSGERSYLPDTGSCARNNKRILGIEPARPSGTGAPTAKRRIQGRRGIRRKEEEAGEEKEEEEEAWSKVTTFSVLFGSST